MKILIIECNEDELRANRTVMECISNALIDFTNRLGVDFDDIEEGEENE